MKKQKGYILVLTIIAIAAIFFFGIIFARYYLGEKSLNQQNEQKMVAGAAAEAGIDQAMYQLKQNHAWTTGFTNVSLPNSKATYSITFNSSQTQIPYSYNNSSNTSAATGYGGRVVPPYSVHLVCVGTYRTQTKNQEAIIGFGDSSLFGDMGIIGDNYLNIFSNTAQNVLIDAFDSSIASYLNTTDRSGGNIATYSITSQNEQLGIVLDAKDTPASKPHGTININGTITIGYGGTAASTLTIPNPDDVTYITPLLNYSQDQPPLANPSTETSGTQNAFFNNQAVNTLAPGTYRDLNVFRDGTVVQLSAGKYVFEDVHIYNSGKIIIPASVTDQVEIHVNGMFRVETGGTIDNQTVNSTTSEIKASNLILYGASVDPENESQRKKIEINDAGTIHMAIYAPNNNISMYDTTYFGAMVGRKIDLYAKDKDVAFHFDKETKNINSPGNGGGDPVVKARW